MIAAKSHPAPYSEEVKTRIKRVIANWPGPFLDPYAGKGGCFDLGVEWMFGIEIEPEFAAMHDLTICGDSATLEVLDSVQCQVRDPRPDHGVCIFDRPRSVVFSPDYGNRFADQYLGTPTERELREETGQEPRRRSYAISLNRRVSEGNGAGHYFWTTDYKTIHQNVAAAVTNVALRPARLLINVSNLIHDQEEHPVQTWWTATYASYGWTFDNAWPVKTKRYKDGANRDARVETEWLISMRLPEVGR